MTGPSPESVPGAAAVPVLPVADLVRSIAWYERLGFTAVGTWDGYAILSFAGAEVHLSELPVDAVGQPSWSGVYLRVTDVDALHARWSALGAPTVAAPADQAHGRREFATEDLDGNLWRIGAPLDRADSASASDAHDPSTSDDAEDGDAVGNDVEADPIPEVADETADVSDGSAGTGDDHWFAIASGSVPCAGCALTPSELPARALGAEVRDVAHALGERLRDADDDAVRRRGPDGSWSALEYGVHVRDGLSVFADRIVRALTQDRPELAWWDHTEAIADGMANESDVGAVADDLGRNAANLSQALRLVTEDDWERSATLGELHPVTVELLARIALHEVVHHLMDARRALDRTL